MSTYTVRHCICEFRGKGGKRHKIDIYDREVARIIRKCQDLPGQHLFQYVDENSERQMVGSSDVNAYLKEISGEEFTAKDYRTWAGTVLAAKELQACGPRDSHVQAKSNVIRAIESVAKRLGNTPAICRKCYIHPDVINSYLAGHWARVFRVRGKVALAGSPCKLRPEEGAVLRLLKRSLRSSFR